MEFIVDKKYRLHFPESVLKGASIKTAIFRGYGRLEGAEKPNLAFFHTQPVRNSKFYTLQKTGKDWCLLGSKYPVVVEEVYKKSTELSKSINNLCAGVVVDLLSEKDSAITEAEFVGFNFGTDSQESDLYFERTASDLLTMVDESCDEDIFKLKDLYRKGQNSAPVQDIFARFKKGGIQYNFVYTSRGWARNHETWVVYSKQEKIEELERRVSELERKVASLSSELSRSLTFRREEIE